MSDDAPKPKNYKVICISIYNEDLARLDEMVATLREKPEFRRANRSALIRHALNVVDLDKIPKGL